MKDRPSETDCFVIMPISDHADFDDGHSTRVYQHIIRPACAKAGLNPVRADDVQNTNYIIIDILRRILDAPIAICDVSTRNPNVLYELGVRHAFNLPVVLIKDTATDRVFDVQGLRTLDYDETLRVDSVQRDCDKLAKVLTATLDSSDDVNSIVQLLGIAKAELNDNASIGAETSLVLDAVRDIAQRLTRIEESSTQSHRAPRKRTRVRLPNGHAVAEGELLLDGPGGTPVGRFVRIDEQGVVVKGEDNEFMFAIPPDQEVFDRLTTDPF